MKTKIADRHDKSNGQGQGMNWIRKEKRLAIYLRDGLACCYCNLGIEDGVKLTLDHVKPHSKGGSNAATNLVTACVSCNSARGKKSVAKFAASASIVAYITKTVRRVVDAAAAKELMARRGGFVNACKK